MKTPSQLLNLCLAAAMATGAISPVAQTKSKPKTSAKTAASKYHRLPPYYGQLKLKKEQIAEIYELRETCGKKIDALEKELKKLKDEQATKCKGVLTRTQVTAYNKLKAAGTKSSTKKSSSRSSSKKK